MTTNTTGRLHAPAPRAAWYERIPPALLVTVLVLLTAAGITTIGRMRLEPAMVAVPTPALPIIIIATSAPAIVVPTAAPLHVAAQLPATVTKRAIIVYGGPDLATTIGPVEPGRPYQLVARWGADWLKVDMTGSGIVFARSSDLLDLPADLVDLQPAPAPQVIYVAAQPAAPAEAAPTPAPSYHNADAPPPADATMVPRQMVLYDRERWALDAARAHQHEDGTP